MSASPSAAAPCRLFLCGDVMTGRGIDQVLPRPVDPRLHEQAVRDAREYVRLAENRSGPIPRLVDCAYPWGDALAELDARQPDLRIINLETSITAGGAPWPKGIHYRMSPDNADCLTAAAIDCCTVANNHVLDWGDAGLRDTLDALGARGIAAAGAGTDADAAAAPAALRVAGDRRVLISAGALKSSGVPSDWDAAASRAGVNRLPDAPDAALQRIAEPLRQARRRGDLVIASIHWGGNWGFEVPALQVDFAHRLVAEAGVDLVHGHSSHHVKALEVYRDRLILYGCGDFLTDYEGIEGHARYRGDLGLMYFPTLAPDTGRLIGLELVPTRVRRLRIERADDSERRWLLETLNRESRAFGTEIRPQPDGTFSVHW